MASFTGVPSVHSWPGSLSAFSAFFAPLRHTGRPGPAPSSCCASQRSCPRLQVMRSQFQMTRQQQPMLILLHHTALHFPLQLSYFNSPLKSKPHRSELKETGERTSVAAALGSSGAEVGAGFTGGEAQREESWTGSGQPWSWLSPHCPEARFDSLCKAVGI